MVVAASVRGPFLFVYMYYYIFFCLCILQAHYAVPVQRVSVLPFMSARVASSVEWWWSRMCAGPFCIYILLNKLLVSHNSALNGQSSPFPI